MAESFEVEIFGHNSIYVDDYLNDNYQKRKFKVYFSVPDNDVNEDTGILLLISGFGGNANSNVYKKMRSQLADKYNLVTIQCDYFGWEFMQVEADGISFNSVDDYVLRRSLEKEDFESIFTNGVLDYDKLIKSNLNKLIKSKLKSKNRIIFNINTNETNEYFCDMGLMQSIDNITAVMFIMNTIYSNEKVFNTKRIMIMGQSHGSYLAYLCNYLCQDLFTHILDNSAWTYPKYLDKYRYILLGKIGDMENEMLEHVGRFDYFASKENIKFDFLNLEKLYKGYNNQCAITVYHGSNDELIAYEEKYEKIKNIPNIESICIDNSLVDGIVFKSTNHGLDADLLELFDLFFRTKVKDEKSTELNFKNSCSINGHNIEIDYSSNLPVLYCYK